jgi:hypothetical protein
MAMVIDRPHAPDLGAWANWLRLPLSGKADAALKAVLAKNDDRLLADAGLRREDALGAEEHFWRDWLRIKEPWTL